MTGNCHRIRNIRVRISIAESSFVGDKNSQFPDNDDLGALDIMTFVQGIKEKMMRMNAQFISLIAEISRMEVEDISGIMETTSPQDATYQARFNKLENRIENVVARLESNYNYISVTAGRISQNSYSIKSTIFDEDIP